MAYRENLLVDNKRRYIHNGISFNSTDAIEVPTVSIKKELGIPDSSLLCLMLGAYHSNKNFDKGHDFLFSSFKEVINQLPRVQLLICGYGSFSDIAKIRDLAALRGCQHNVHLSGFRNDIPSIMKYVDLVLISSQVFETFCFAAVEAMAHKIPVVATNVGAIPEIVIDGQGGYCVEKNDTTSYSNRILSLLRDGALRQDQGLKGYKRFKRAFYWNSHGSRIRKHYSQ